MTPVKHLALSDPRFELTRSNDKTVVPDQFLFGRRATREKKNMQVPLQIVFENIERSDAVEARVREEIEKLTLFSDRMTSARVVVARPQHRRHQGDAFQVRIQLDVLGARPSSRLLRWRESEFFVGT